MPGTNSNGNGNAGEGELLDKDLDVLTILFIDHVDNFAFRAIIDRFNKLVKSDVGGILRGDVQSGIEQPKG